MNNFFVKPVYILLFLIIVGCQSRDNYQIIDHHALANKYFHQDAGWYLHNIPFFECSDKNIEQVYYYRWKLYKAHIRNIGHNEYVITEFIDHVSWDREPYCTINAASMHHIYEGRWLKDSRYLKGYINYLYQNGGNDRRYSEGIAEAAYANYLVDGDSAFITAQLESMKHIYNLWSDHWDSTKSLYFIPAMPDATEYTIASIDASGGKDGFEGGEAFRPTINSYMYGNALAISRIAGLKGDQEVSRVYFKKANQLKSGVMDSLWNPVLQHFTDRYKVDNQFVHYWDFIRGRELAGFIPWFYNLPEDITQFNEAWIHLKDTTQLLGHYGLRTNEPSYEYYFKQFVYTFNKPGSQWNGPSWPYQTSQVITAMANLLNDYNQQVVSSTDYLKILRLFTRQHFLPDGKLNLVENYDPNKGGPIVYFYWSNHYNHSTFNNLVISGLCGVRPSAGEMLDINPLIDSTIQYFCLSEVMIHGHSLTIIFDRDGQKYKVEEGLTVYIDGKKAKLFQNGNKYQVRIGKTRKNKSLDDSPNRALNIRKNGYPVPSASVNAFPDSLFQAFDGRIWYFPEIRNRWSTLGSKSSIDWLAVDFGQLYNFSHIRIYPYTDEKIFTIPVIQSIEYLHNGEWNKVEIVKQIPAKITGNTENLIEFDKITTSSIRVNLEHENQQIAITEIECY